MQQANLIKRCSIAGFILAEIYMIFVVLGPNNVPVPETRMIIPKIMIPKEEGVAPGAKPPIGTQITRVAVGAVFFGPFGALAGLGVGLLLEGLRQTLQGTPKKKTDGTLEPKVPEEPKEPQD